MGLIVAGAGCGTRTVFVFSNGRIHHCTLCACTAHREQLDAERWIAVEQGLGGRVASGHRGQQWDIGHGTGATAVAEGTPASCGSAGPCRWAAHLIDRPATHALHEGQPSASPQGHRSLEPVPGLFLSQLQVGKASATFMPILQLKKTCIALDIRPPADKQQGREHTQTLDCFWALPQCISVGPGNRDGLSYC